MKFFVFLFPPPPPSFKTSNSRHSWTSIKHPIFRARCHPPLHEKLHTASSDRNRAAGPGNAGTNLARRQPTKITSPNSPRLQEPDFSPSRKKTTDPELPLSEALRCPRNPYKPRRNRSGLGMWGIKKKLHRKKNSTLKLFTESNRRATTSSRLAFGLQTQARICFFLLLARTKVCVEEIVVGWNFVFASRFRCGRFDSFDR